MSAEEKKLTLHSAATQGNWERVKEILQKDPTQLETINDDKVTIIVWAAWKRQWHIVERIAKEFPSQNEQYLNYNYGMALFSIFSFLANNHPVSADDVIRTTTAINALYERDTKAFIFFYDPNHTENNTGNLATRGSSLELLKQLAEKYPAWVKMNKNSVGDTAVVVAARHLCWQNVHYLCDTFQNDISIEEWTKVLFVATDNKNWNSVNYLWNRFKDSISVDAWRKILLAAAGSAVDLDTCADISIAILTKYPASKDVTDRDGNNLMHLAAIRGNTRLLQILLQQHFDLSTNINQQTKAPLFKVYHSNAFTYLYLDRNHRPINASYKSKIDDKDYSLLEVTDNTLLNTFLTCCHNSAQRFSVVNAMIREEHTALTLPQNIDFRRGPISREVVLARVNRKKELLLDVIQNNITSCSIRCELCVAFLLDKQSVAWGYSDNMPGSSCNDTQGNGTRQKLFFILEANINYIPDFATFQQVSTSVAKLATTITDRPQKDKDAAKELVKTCVDALFNKLLSLEVQQGMLYQEQQLQPLLESLHALSRLFPGDLDIQAKYYMLDILIGNGRESLSYSQTDAALTRAVVKMYRSWAQPENGFFSSEKPANHAFLIQFDAAVRQQCAANKEKEENLTAQYSTASNAASSSLWDTVSSFFGESSSSNANQTVLQALYEMMTPQRDNTYTKRT